MKNETNPTKSKKAAGSGTFAGLSTKTHALIIFLSLLIWGVTFYTDTKIFSSDGLNMNCLPVDTGMIPFMHVLTKICVLLFWYGMLRFLHYGLSHKKVLIYFLCLMAIYGIGLLVTYPGYYMNDDPIIFAYVTRYLPVYWHNYLTSLFYMTGMSVFPASCGPVLLSDVCYALTFTYLFTRGSQAYECTFAGDLTAATSITPILQKILLILPAILPFTLLGALMCFRPAIYSSFFLFYYLILYFDHQQKKSLTLAKLLLLTFLTALLSHWRSESIVLLPLSCFLIPLVYYRKNETSKDPDTATSAPSNDQQTDHLISILRHHPLLLALSFLIISTALFALISVPQKHGEKAYYGSDYLIISTTRPLSVIVWRDQTYEGAEEDIENISAITEFGYLHNDSLSCSAYTRYNTDHNEGRYTQTGADAETQKKYLKSAFRLILHNLDLYFGERIQLFCVTNGFFNYNQDMVLNLKPIVSTDFHLYEHDRDYGFEMLNAFLRVPLSYHDDYAMFLYKYGGEALIPMLILCLAALIYSLVKKKWFLFFSFGSLLAREAVIFLSAPASFIQYSYPTMFVTAAFCLLILGSRKSDS